MVTGATLEPIRMVERVLTGPDGQTLRVTVPVYPPFRLAERPVKAGVRRRPPEEKKAS
jgi:hypothetical protein